MALTATTLAATAGKQPGQGKIVCCVLTPQFQRSSHQVHYQLSKVTEGSDVGNNRLGDSRMSVCHLGSTKAVKLEEQSIAAGDVALAQYMLLWLFNRGEFTFLTGKISGQVGGPINYAIFSFWIFMSFAGFAIAMSSMSALQHYENKTGISDGETLHIHCSLWVMILGPYCIESVEESALHACKCLPSQACVPCQDMSKECWLFMTCMYEAE